MICKRCKKEFISFLSPICPYCGCDNTVTWGDVWETATTPIENKREKGGFGGHDPDDWEYYDNCSDREYMDDEDYDDFDN